MGVFRRIAPNPDGVALAFFCPGCKCTHGIWLEGPVSWQWNGNLDRPTITPSLKIDTSEPATPTQAATPHICHSTITDGLITFCPDCTHPLACRTVPLEEF